MPQEDDPAAQVQSEVARAVHRLAAAQERIAKVLEDFYFQAVEMHGGVFQNYKHAIESEYHANR